MGDFEVETSKEYVPIHHRSATYKKMAYLKQETSKEYEYINDFEKLMVLGDVEESEEQKMAHFTSGLNYNIAGIVELYPCFDFDALCSLCLKVESQGKA